MLINTTVIMLLANRDFKMLAYDNYLCGQAHVRGFLPYPSKDQLRAFVVTLTWFRRNIGFQCVMTF